MLTSPPALTLYAMPMLGKVIDDIYYELSHRAKKLEEYKRPERLTRVSGGDDQMTQLLAMRSLNRALPMLKHYRDARRVHPWEVYGLLCQLVGIVIIQRRLFISWRMASGWRRLIAVRSPESDCLLWQRQRRLSRCSMDWFLKKTRTLRWSMSTMAFITAPWISLWVKRQWEVSCYCCVQRCLLSIVPASQRKA